MAWKIAYGIFASLVIVGCGTDDVSSQKLVSKVIGVSGGALTSADGAFTVTVGENAFDAATEVTIEIHRGVADSHLTSRVYEVRPHNVRLQAPAQLSLTVDNLPQAEDLEDVRFAQIQPALSMLEGVTFDTVASQITAQTREFSSYGAFLSDVCQLNDDCGSGRVCDRGARICVDAPAPCEDGFCK